MPTEDFDRDPAVTLQMRSMLRPPADAAYWDGLEARIMDRIRAETTVPAADARPSGGFAIIGGWWEPFAQWRRVGAVAAAAVLVLAAWSYRDTSRHDDRLAYEAAVEAMSTPLDSLGRPMTDVPREKTVPDLFRY